LGLASHPRRARRWAFGAYASGVEGVTDVGEMHIRPGAYLGIAPLGAGLFNVCAVTGPRPEGPAPLDVVRRAIARDPAIAARFERVEFQTPVRVLGPLAVEARAVGVPGLLLAGDAAGFVDPMTGDGLHLAMRGAMLAAREALTALERGDLAGAVGRLEIARHAEIGRKQRFNRWLRRLVDSPVALDVAAMSSRVTPGLIRWAIRFAGDAA
jgi:flavin-dependent dehydrogenase